MHHKYRYKHFTNTHHFVMITRFFTCGGINFLNRRSPIVTSPDSTLAPEKSPSYDAFNKSL